MAYGNPTILLAFLSFVLLIPSSTGLFDGNRNNEVVNPFKRTKVGILGIDILTLNTDSAIQKAMATGDLKKVDEVCPDINDMQWLLKNYFKNARFYSKPFGYFMAFRKDPKSTRAYLDKKFTPGAMDVSNSAKDAADILFDKKLSKKKADNALIAVFVNVIGCRFLPGKSNFPSKTLNLHTKVIASVVPALLPTNRWRSRRAVKKVCMFMKDAAAETGDFEKYKLHEGCPIDLAHPILTGSLHAVDCLREIAKDPDQDVELMMCRRKGTTDKIPRMVTQDSTLGGLLPLDNPAIAGKTVVLLKIGAAAKETDDISYAFGAGPKGSRDRQCAAKPAILEFLKAVQSEVRMRK